MKLSQNNLILKPISLRDHEFELSKNDVTVLGEGDFKGFVTIMLKSQQ